MTDWNRTYMGFAVTVARHSKAEKEKVGCVIVKNNSVISLGYNGTPPGYDNTCEDKHMLSNTSYRYITKPEVVHAEINAIAKLARTPVSAENSLLYVTKPPCFECAKLIVMAGIKYVFFLGTVEDEMKDSISFLQLNNVTVIRMTSIKYGDENGYC